MTRDNLITYLLASGWRHSENHPLGELWVSPESLGGWCLPVLTDLPPGDPEWHWIFDKLALIEGTEPEILQSLIKSVSISQQT